MTKREFLKLLLLGFALYFVVTALGYGRNSRIFPMAIGIPTVILLALAFIGVWKPGLLRGAEVDFGAPSGGACLSRRRPKRATSRRCASSERSAGSSLPWPASPSSVFQWQYRSTSCCSGGSRAVPAGTRASSPRSSPGRSSSGTLTSL